MCEALRSPNDGKSDYSIDRARPANRREDHHQRREHGLCGGGAGRVSLIPSHLSHPISYLLSYSSLIPPSLSTIAFIAPPPLPFSM